MSNFNQNRENSFGYPNQSKYHSKPVNIPAHLLPKAFFDQQQQQQLDQLGQQEQQEHHQPHHQQPNRQQQPHHQQQPHQQGQQPHQQGQQPHQQGEPQQQFQQDQQQRPNQKFQPQQGQHQQQQQQQQNFQEHQYGQMPQPSKEHSRPPQTVPHGIRPPPLNQRFSQPVTPVTSLFNEQPPSPYSVQTVYNPPQPVNSVHGNLPYPVSPQVSFKVQNQDAGSGTPRPDPPYPNDTLSNRDRPSRTLPLSAQLAPQIQGYPPNGYPSLQQQPLAGPIPLQQRRSTRKVPPNALPPITTKKSFSEQRRIVSSPSLPQNGSASSLTQMAPNQSMEARTRSLSSTSTKYSQNQLQRMQPIQQSPTLGQQFDQNQNQRPHSSGSASTVHHTFSLSSKSRSFSSISKLSSSLSTKKFNSSSSLANGKLDRNPSIGTMSTRTFAPIYKNPIVYPSLLSEVAKIFKESVILTINTKDGLEYHDTFTGKMAVDIICRIIRTNDRNLALLLGRSLDAQKFFHDVTYNHRLRDSVHEVYAFSHIYSDVEFYQEDGNNGSGGNNSANNSKHGTFIDNGQTQQLQLALQDHVLLQQLPNHQPMAPSYDIPSLIIGADGSSTSLSNMGVAQKELTATQQTGVNGVFTILTDCYSPTCTRNRLCYSIACPRRLEQQARLNLKPQGGLKRAVSRLSLHEKEETKTLWHETVPQSVLDNLDKQEKMRQELIYEFIYTERDYVKDLEFMTDFYIMPLRNPANNIIPEHQRETFIHTVFGGVGDLLRLAKSFSEALTRRQQQQKPVVEALADIFLDFVGNFEPFIRYTGNKVFASFEHERQQQVNMKYARFLDTIEKKPESRRQDLSGFLIKGVQRPARYQLLLGGILKNTKPESPDYKNLVKAKEEIEKVLTKINIQTGESTDRHKIMVLHRLLGKQTLENKYNFKLTYNHRIIYQVTLNRKRDNEKIDMYLFEHAILLVKHKIQNKREQHKVFEKPIYLPLLFINSGFEIPTVRSIINHRYRGSLVVDTGIKNKVETTNYIGTSSNSNAKLQLNILGLGSNQVHATLFAEDLTIQNQVLQQIHNQQKKMIEKHDLFSLYKFETRRFHGNNKINCAVPCYGGKKLLYGTDSGVWVSTVRSISASSNEKICSDPTMVISKLYVTQIEVLVEYSKLLILSDKGLYEFDLSCTDSLDHVKNTKSGKLIMSHVAFFKIGVCDGRLLVCGAKTGGAHAISIFEPTNPFDKHNQRNKNRKNEVRDITFSSDPISISFLKTHLCVGCTKGFEILSLEEGKKEPILDEADPSLDFAIQRETVTPLAIHKLGHDFLLCYAEFVFLINRNGWRTNHDWSLFWEGNPQNVALFFPYLLSFEPGFIEIRDLHSTNLLRSLVGEKIRFLHSNEHEAMYACEENGYDIIVSIDFLNLKPKAAEP